VKLEGGVSVKDIVKALVKAGIPVMGHIGLTPQTISMLGGFKVQARMPKGLRRLLTTPSNLKMQGSSLFSSKPFQPLLQRR